MTIEQELLNNTPLPLDIIRFCIEPFLIPDQAHWRRKFNLVMCDIHDLRGGIRSIYDQGQKMRSWWAYHKHYIITTVTFKFALDVSGYRMIYQIIMTKPSLISRIKSWFKRQK